MRYRPALGRGSDWLPSGGAEGLQLRAGSVCISYGPSLGSIQTLTVWVRRAASQWAKRPERHADHRLEPLRIDISSHPYHAVKKYQVVFLGIYSQRVSVFF
jgi:hypothetical protein